MSADDAVIRVTNISKRYRIYDTPRDRLKQFVLPRLRRLAGLAPQQYFREFEALKDVSFEIARGETVGVIGRNGSGKSTLLQIICGTLSPTAGQVETSGRVASILELGAGFNPEFSGRDNVYLNGAVLGLRRDEIDARFDRIAAFSDIGEYLDQPVKTYSSGMYVRLAFAVAIHVEPAILVVDEAIAVGDVRFQNKCLRQLNELRNAGCSILFVSHNSGIVEAFCDRVVWLERGQVRECGDPAIIVRKYIDFMVHGVSGRGDSIAAAQPAAGDGAAGWAWQVLGSANNVRALPGYGIRRVRVKSANRFNPVRFDPAPVEICMQCEIVLARPVEQPLFAFGVHNELNEPVVHFNTHNIAVALGALPAERPLTLEITVRLPALRPGDYLIELGLDDGILGAHRLLCHVYDAWTFTVSPPADGRPQSGYVQTSGASIVLLEAGQ